MDEVYRGSLLGPDAETGLRLGAALAFAQAALELAVTQAAIEDERLQRTTLLGNAQLAIEAAGHDHIGQPIDAALANIDCASLTRTSARSRPLHVRIWRKTEG